MRITLLGNFDSFTYNLVEQFYLLGAEIRVMRSDTPLPTIQAALLADGCELLVLSPRLGQPEDAGCMLKLFAQVHGRLPMLGACLDHQALALATSGAVGETRKPLHSGSTSLRFDQHHPLFDGIADLRIARYHLPMVNRLPRGFNYLTDADNGIMAMTDSRDRQLGLQFRPESIFTTHGQRPLENALLWYGTPAIHERLRARAVPRHFDDARLPGRRIAETPTAEFMQALADVFEKAQEATLGSQRDVVVAIHFGVDAAWFVEFVEDCQGTVAQALLGEVMRRGAPSGTSFHQA